MLYRWKEPSCPRAVASISYGLILYCRKSTHRRGDGTIMSRDALGGEVDTVGSLELHLKGS